jgi:D-tagatose-1,6-bisphosphate aldolase subunit GatZ/KbaZ
LQDAWKRVIAVVVQPGVEFSDSTVIEYDRRKAVKLSAFISGTDDLVYEAHSTDYQLPASLTQMVKDHFAILKVGPWFTFAFREAVFSFAEIEEECLKSRKSMVFSRIKSVLEQAMLDNPRYWQQHYHGTDAEQALARAFSYSDRVRYYWPDPRVQESLNRLLYNMMIHPPPLNLISQYFPAQYWKIRGNVLKNEPVQIIHDFIRGVIKYYATATGMQKEKRRRLT